MKRSERRAVEFQKCLDRITATMQNYPDGKITDLLGANTIYALMNKAVVLGKKAGYREEEITERILAARAVEPPKAAPVTVAHDSIVFDP